MMAVDCSEIKNTLLDKCNGICVALELSIQEHISENKTYLISRISEIMTIIRKNADKAKDLVTLEDYIDNIR